MPIPDEEWDEIKMHLRPVSYKKKAIIFAPGKVATESLLVTSGVAAAKTLLENGQEPTERFFVPIQGCANIVSAWRCEPTSETIYAATDVEGALMSWEFIRGQFLDGAAFGRFGRVKMLDSIVLDKQILTMKTTCSTELNYKFLEENFPEVIGGVAQKVIASYLGLTPEGLSRFLKRRREAAS